MEKLSNLDFNDVFHTLQQNLLDMGLRNNLLNFKEVARTIPVVDIDLMDLFDSVVINKNKLSFIPKSSSNDSGNRLWRIPIDLGQQDDTQLQTPLTEKDLQKRLFSLFQYNKTSVQDLGYNTLFLALGFVEWKQPRESGTHKAPLILIPIELFRRSVGSPFKIKWSSEDISLNLSLRHKLQDLGVILPDQDTIESRNDFAEYIDKVKREIKHQPGWNVLDEAYISTFSFKKFVMYKDLTLDNWSKNINNSEIGRLFGLSSVEDFDSFDVSSIDEELNPMETYNVVDADSSQMAVIEDVKKGHSLVVEGPPGTGKSQTIVNLISELLANGNKILFVSEKMAALDVVKKRMDSVGLGNYCLELHSNKTKKRAFLDDLNKSLLNDTVEVNDFEDYKKLQNSINYLNEYREVIRTKYGNTNYTTYDLIGLYEYKYQELERLGQRVYKFNLPNLKGLDSDKLDEITSNIDEIAEIYKLINPIKDNPWNYTNVDYISPDQIDNINSKSFEIDSHMNKIVEEIDTFSEKSRLEKPTKFGEINNFIQQAKLLLSDQDYSSKEDKLKSIVDAVQEYQSKFNNNIDVSKIDIEPIKQRFDELLIQIRTFEISYDIMFHKEVQLLLSKLKEASRSIQESPVKRALNDKDIFQKFYQFKANKDSFTKFMNKDYKKAKNELKSYYLQDVNDDQITEDFANLLKWNDDVISVKNSILPYTSNSNMPVEKIIYELERLIATFEEVNEINFKISKLFKKEYFKTLDDLETHINLLYDQKSLKEFIDDNNSLAKKSFKSWNNVDSNLTELISEYDNISSFVKKDNITNVAFDEFTKRELDSLVYDLELLYEQIEEDYEYLNSTLHFKSKLSKKNIKSIKINEFNDLIQEISGNIRSLSNWSQFNTFCSQFKNKYTEELIRLIRDDKVKPDAIVPLFEYNFANNILIDVFKDNDLLKNFNSNIYEKNIEIFKELDVETINLNRYRVKHILDEKRPSLTNSIAPISQLGILVHEMNKKRNYKSIRQVLNECHDIVTDIKPCLLMSPLSIAQYLDTKTFESYFDYIIFDEASQVKIEDAIGALLRGKHYVIMGDTKQLPPTSFFDVETNVESQEAEEMHVQDVESILHFCKTVLPYRMLKCHYRSRHESLIAVSNLEFYNNDLLIYPSPVMNSDELGLKLIYNPNNVYDKGKTRQNKSEAREVASYALNHFRKYGYTKSLGIGTFSVAQKQAILEELELQLQTSPELDQYVNATGDKAFFVKNIENIQGDERDVMLISVGYGFDETHNLSMSFGPLNNDGGERRLNVLTTRAKEKCVVFSNFKSADMHITPRTPKGVKVLKTYLYYAEKGRFPSDYIEEEDFDSQFEESVYNFLISEGYKVEKRVGCAGYRIDLAIIDPSNKEEYILAIECDGSSYNDNSSARERDRIRQNILEGLGWSFYRIWSVDWYHNRQYARQKLIQAIQLAIRDKEEHLRTLQEINDEEVIETVDNSEDSEFDEISITPDKSEHNDNVKTESFVQEDDSSTNVQDTTDDDVFVDEFDEIFEVLDEEDLDELIIPDIKEIRNSDVDFEELTEYPSDSQEVTEETVEEVETPTVSEENNYESSFEEEPEDNGNSYEQIDEEPQQDNTESIKDKIKSKIQVKKVVANLKSENDYDYYENNIDCDDFYSLNDSDVLNVIEDIIHTESPIHREEIYNRLKKVYNVKATKKFKTRIDSLINTLLQSSTEIYVKNNYYYVFNKEIRVRKRIKPNIDYISDDEIIEAIKQVLILNADVKMNDLSKQVSKLFGFKSLSGKTANKLNEVISFLRFSNKLSIDENNVVILKDSN